MPSHPEMKRRPYRVTPELIHQVRELHQAGISQRRIAKQIRVWRGIVEGILHGHYDPLLDRPADFARPEGLDSSCQPLPHQRCPCCGKPGYLVEGLCVACLGKLYRRMHGTIDLAGVEEPSDPGRDPLALDFRNDPAMEDRYREVRPAAEARRRELKEAALGSLDSRLD